jgi:broad specificity phosphatase PhoE
MKLKNSYFLLRHGQTIYQTEKVDFFYPWPDFETQLTEIGREQVEKSAKKLKKEGINLIYCSDFKRTLETAQILSRETGAEIKADERLRELNFGIFKERKIKDYLDFFGDEKKRFEKRPPEGENWRDIKERMSSFVEETERNNSEKNIAVISHGDPLWILAGVLLDINEEDLFKKRSDKKFYLNTGEFLKIKRNGK